MVRYTKETLFEFLTETLEAAGDVVSSYVSDDLQVEHKADSTLVTEADLASENLIIGNIKESFSGDSIYSEESNRNFAKRRTGSYVWIIDPLDGTTNFINNYPFYCISIALGQVLESGKIEPMAGGIYNPIDKSTYLAYRDGGAFCNGQKIFVSEERDFADSFLVYGFYYRKDQNLTERVDAYFSIASEVNSIRRDGATALDLALVSRGVYDGLWEEGVKPWDVAAGCLLVTEAGGRVCNYHSNAFDIEAGNIIAGNAATVSRVGQIINQDDVVGQAVP